MQTTPLTDIHRALGAKLVDFAGYEMPLTYSSLKEEHFAVREAVGMFDVSHMGEFIVRGEGARDLVQYVTSNDVDKLSPGKAQYSCLPRPGGGIVDDLLVYRLPLSPSMEKETLGYPSYMLVVNASNIHKDLAWIQSHNDFGAEILDISARTALLAVQGPEATRTLQTLTEENLSEIPYYHFIRGRMAGKDNVIISNTGYTGSGGFELYFQADAAAEVWEKIMRAGREFGIKPCGLGARDTLRLEKGFALYGNDINDETSALEAGLGWITKLDTQFVGRDFLAAQKEAGIPRRLVGFKVDGRRAPRPGHKILTPEGDLIGEVTSGTHSPSLDVPIGLGYVESGHHTSGTAVRIDMGRKQLAAEVTRPPFLK